MESRKKNRDGGLIQLQTEQVLLTYLLAASVNDNNSFIVKSNFQKALADLKTFIEEKNKTAVDATYKGHLLLALERMKEPEKAKPTIHKEIPPGLQSGVIGRNCSTTKRDFEIQAALTENCVMASSLFLSRRFSSSISKSSCRPARILQSCRNTLKIVRQYQQLFCGCLL
jgi:hypothetical protein